MCPKNSKRGETNKFEEEYPFVVSTDDFVGNDVIGKGVNGDVIQKKFVKDKTIVAVKTFKEMKKKAEVSKFKNEIKALSKCENIYCTKLFGYTNKAPFQIMTKFIENGNLYNRISNKSKPLNSTQKTIIAACLALGLKKVHSEKIIHRDIKSLNVLLDKKNYPVICDFGSSIDYSTGKPNGDADDATPNWMPPEFLNNEEFDEKLDVYSYGMVLYEMLTSEIPFKGDDIPTIRKKVINGERPEIPENTTQSLKDLITKCWSQDPKKRPTMDDIYKMFLDQKVDFGDVDDDKIVANIEKLKNDDDKMHANIYKKVSKVNKGFSKEIEKILPKREPEYVPVFFREFAWLFAPETKKFKFSALLSASMILMQKKPGVEAFLAEGLHYRLPYDNEELRDQAISILYLIVYHAPDTLDVKYCQYIPYLMEFRPNKILVIASEFTKEMENIKDPFPFLDAVLRSYKKAKKSLSAAPKFVALFYYICRVYKVYDTKRHELCLKVFERFLDCESKAAVCAAYTALSHFEGDRLKVDYSELVKYLKDPATASTITSVVLRLGDVEVEDSSIRKEFVRTMLARARESNRAGLCCCKIAESPDGAEELTANLGWLSLDLPTIYNTFQILLTVLQHESHRASIGKSTDFVGLMFRAMQKGSGIPIKVIGQVLLGFELTSENVEFWSNQGLLKQLIYTAGRNNDEKSITVCALVFQELALEFDLDEFSTAIDLVCVSLPKFPDMVEVATNFFLAMSHINRFALQLYDYDAEKLVEEDITKSDRQKIGEALHQNLMYAVRNPEAE